MRTLPKQSSLSVSSGQAELVYLDFSSFCSCSLRRSRQRAYCPALAGSGAKSFAYPISVRCDILTVKEMSKDATF